MKASDVEKELQKLADPKRAKTSEWFFKTGKGEYGDGDIFLGITVPTQRTVAKKYKELPLTEVRKLLLSKVHEHRFVALEILVFKYEHGSEIEKKKIVTFYLKNKRRVNNWDLVDTSAPYILGNWLLDKDTSILYKLAHSKNLWDKRIAIVATYAFIQNNRFEDTLKIAKILLTDTHDLIHKAVGWMLREVGKKSESILERFLTQHYRTMPRTTLRYAIERFPETKRKRYLKK